MPNASSTTAPSPFDAFMQRVYVVRFTLIALGCLSAVLLYCFSNSLIPLWDYWKQPQYSHGYLVPVFAAILLWMRWDGSALQPFEKVSTSSRWWGVGLLTAGLLARIGVANLGMEIPDMLTFVPSLAGVLLLAGGLQLLRWAGPITAFLVFMFPLPHRTERWILEPLQKIATIGSEYVLQTLGYGAFREGNVINMGEMKMNVVEQCSGLRMLTIFLALCIAVALIISRPWWERVLVVLSAVPIALAVNMIRITVTGMANYHMDGAWHHQIHDWAGLVMPLLAMGILYVEMLVLAKIVVDEGTDKAGAAAVNLKARRRRTRSAASTAR